MKKLKVIIGFWALSMLFFVTSSFAELATIVFVDNKGSNFCVSLTPPEPYAPINVLPHQKRGETDTLMKAGGMLTVVAFKTIKCAGGLRYPLYRQEIGSRGDHLYENIVVDDKGIKVTQSSEKGIG
ncbi:hypothetical protein MJO48_17455 [Dickeya fangzhongdai]|uniref:hypothetical protein n=1 Tax=Dickeya fangzhongdai TaxID=1778540 RepID=UPI001EFB18A3|nr:hypothetical protein [Dickeya fangzhongdai]ULR30222.1 hypothetical protein MJO48_17455 [Dickeya fangzhongdai]